MSSLNHFSHPMLNYGLLTSMVLKFGAYTDGAGLSTPNNDFSYSLHRTSVWFLSDLPIENAGGFYLPENDHTVLPIKSV